MKTTKVFKSGNSMAVRLPKDFHIEGDTVSIERRGDEIVIKALPLNLASAFDLFGQLPDDVFEDGRQDTPPQKREDF